MNGLLTAGRLFFAIAMVFFGFQFAIFAASLTGPVPGPPWTHGSVLVAWLVAAAFLMAGLSIAVGTMARWVSLFLGSAILLFGLVHYLPILLTHLHDPGPWTVLFELLALGGGALVAAASFPDPPADGFVFRLGHAGRFLVAISLVVFAVQHFMYARFVATLVPAWIPARLFWAYFTGVAFVAAALALASRKMLRLAAMLLGTMFFLWVVLLHIPRVAGAIRNGNEVTSLFVAVAMCGLSFVLAGTYGRSLEGYGAH
jgi:uncharacterized membrane protein